MLLTSGQVSIVISSIIIITCTTTLFLCGYVIQQNTVNNIRKAIRPIQRTVFTDHYIPSGSDVVPTLNAGGEGGDQATELIIEALAGGGQEGKSAQPPFLVQVPEDESEERLVQGSDGGFLRVVTKKQKIKGEEPELESPRRPFVEEAYREGISNPRKSADEAVERDSTQESMERLSRAARRKALRDEMKKKAVADEALLGTNPYRRRRMW